MQKTLAKKHARRAAVIIDAEDYFRFARSAMLKARKRIMLVGWDFDARIELLHGAATTHEAPTTIGALITALVDRTPGLEVFILRWDLGALKTLFRGTTPLTLVKWALHPRIHVQLDGHHPAGASHHQKIVVIDDCFAFCGGIDMTAERWDTRAHRDDEDGRRLSGGNLYKPWHDATCAVDGAAASRLAAHCRDRWRRATGVSLPAVRARHDCWPEGLDPDFHSVDVAIARSVPKMPGQRAVLEVEQLFLEQIATARRCIYAESQYFASRRIAEALARRLGEADGPEIVIVNPEEAEGWLEPIAMDTARARLVTTLRQRDVHDRFRVYHPYTRDGAPIYVHAKILVVDDRLIRVGSANLNNRSMRLDTECDISVDCAEDRVCSAAIAGIRNGLLAEHLGLPREAVERSLEKTGSLIRTIESLRFTGRKNARDRRSSLRPYTVPELSTVEKWLADNEVLDPEGPELFETLASRGLFRNLRKPAR